MIAKTMCIASAGPVVLARVGTPSALPVKIMPFNLPGIEEYIRHPIPMSKYDRQALLQDGLTAPKRIHRLSRM